MVGVITTKRIVIAANETAREAAVAAIGGVGRPLKELSDECSDSLHVYETGLSPAEVKRASLSGRELDVLRGMAEGLSNGQIGHRIEVSEDTVKTHVRRLFRRLGARDRANAVLIGYRLGVLGGES